MTENIIEKHIFTFGFIAALLIYLSTEKFTKQVQILAIPVNLENVALFIFFLLLIHSWIEAITQTSIRKSYPNSKWLQKTLHFSEYFSNQIFFMTMWCPILAFLLIVLIGLLKKAFGWNNLETVITTTIILSGILLLIFVIIRTYNQRLNEIRKKYSFKQKYETIKELIDKDTQKNKVEIISQIRNVTLEYLKQSLEKDYLLRTADFSDKEIYNIYYQFETNKNKKEASQTIIASTNIMGYFGFDALKLEVSFAKELLEKTKILIADRFN